MKKHVCAAALALCFVLAACAPEPGASSASVPSSSAAASSLPPASGTAGQAAPPLDLPYEKIQPVADHATPYPYLACGFDGSGPVYYTMCRGGLWGLMREDFTVVLECRAPQPVTRCHLGHWSWGSDGMNWDELDASTPACPKPGTAHWKWGTAAAAHFFIGTWTHPRPASAGRVKPHKPLLLSPPPFMSDTAYSSPFSFPSWLKAR
ncbi:MAG: hypothetical protein ACLSWY_00460 [Ruthenibacterium lactatiformans]